MQQNQVAKTMDSNNEGQKEVKQYKDFMTLTSLRKVTQQALAPTIYSLQTQLTSILDQYKTVNKRITKMDDIEKANIIIEQRLEETNKIIRQYKQQQAFKWRETEKKFAKSDTANQKLILDIHSLKLQLQNNQEEIKQINNNNIKIEGMYKNLSMNNEKFVSQMQNKYFSFTKQILQTAKTMKQDHHKIHSEMEGMKESFKIQRNAIQQKSKPLQLYFNERQSTNDKINELYTKILSSVTKNDFESYRKSQKLIVDEQFEKITKQIEDIFPSSIRAILPSLEQRLKQVEKVKFLERKIEDFERQSQNFQKRVLEQNQIISKQILGIKTEFQQQSLLISKQLYEKINKIEEQAINMGVKLQQKMLQMKLQIQQGVSDLIEKQTSQIHRTIQAQISNQNSLNAFDMKKFIERDQIIQREVEQIRETKQKILSRYDRIEELGSSIDDKLDAYSSKITRIKSDSQLFADNIRKEVSGVIKFRDTFLDKLKEVGRLLSTYTECLFIISSVLLQNSYQNSRAQINQSLVYISDFDGIIYEWKPDYERGFIHYRKQKMEMKLFLKSFIYSLINLTNNQYEQLAYLNWKDNKPSGFFKQNVVQNYVLTLQRIMGQMNMKKRSSSQIHGWTQNQNIIREQVQLKGDLQQATNSTKQFSRTIQSKSRFDNVLVEQGNMIIPTEENKKIYNIKKPKPNSSRPKTKQKSSSQFHRYEIFTSRSGRRSRISQLI